MSRAFLAIIVYFTGGLEILINIVIELVGF